MGSRKFLTNPIVKLGLALVLMFFVSFRGDVSSARSPEDLQRQAGELERAISACGNDLDCLNKVLQNAAGMMKDLQSRPEVANAVAEPCYGFNGESQPSPAGSGEVECIPFTMRISHKATTRTAGCTKEDERFTYSYVYDIPGQLIRDTGRKAYILNSLTPSSGNDKHLTLQHLEYVILEFGDNCRPTGSARFGRADVDFGANPAVALSYDHGYTTPEGKTAFFAPLTGWVSPKAAYAHWGTSIPFQIGGGFTSSEELVQAGLSFSPAELDAAFDGQLLTRRLQWKTSSPPNQTALNELEIVIDPMQQTPPPCRLLITSPKEGSKLSFSTEQTGQLTFSLSATTKPVSNEQKITWSLPQFDPDTQVRVEPKNRRGPNLKVTLRGLPKDISGLGEKVFTASINEKKCNTSATRTVKLFFPRDAKNNPGGKLPNWFYYWKQTPAGRPKGQIVALDYGGSTKDLCGTAGVTGIYNPKYGYKVIQICDLSKLKTPFELVFPLLDRLASNKYSGMRTVRNIDTFAVAVLHEYQHFLTDHNWYSNITPQDLPKKDKDQDGIPDHLEPGLNFKSTMFQTYFANHPKLKNIGGDEEWLAYEIMKDHKPGSLDKYDWAYPGNQWTP